MNSWLLASLCGGLFLAQFGELPTWWPALPGVLVLASLSGILRRPAPWLLCLALAGIAPLLYQQALNPPIHNRDLRLLADGQQHILSGKLLRARQNARGSWSLDLDELELHNLGIIRRQGLLRLYVDELQSPPTPGDRLQFKTRLRRPRAFGTPGESNYPRHLASQGIYVTGFLKSDLGLVRWANTGPRDWRQRLAVSRQQAAMWLDDSLSAARAPLAKALLLGDRSGFSHKLRKRISRTGLAHLLAISGLHLGLLAWFLYRLAMVVYRRSTRLMLLQPPARILPALLIGPLVLYTLFTGGALSTWRALLMYSIAALLLLRAERQRPIDLLKLALFCLLMIDPLAFFEPGLQLSAAGVAGILLFVPRWKQLFSRTPQTLQRILEVPLATLAATLTTAPLVAMHFHQLVPAGLVSNLFAIPLIGFGALPLGLLGLAGHMAGIPASELPVQWSGWLLDTTLAWGDTISRWTLVTPTPWFPDPKQLLASLILILALLGFSYKRWRSGSLLTLCALFICVLPMAPRGELSLTTLSVGQGESLLLTRPDDSRLLIDGGGLRSQTFDIGERLIAPALGWLGVHRLDSVILTHAHPDHYRGLVAVLEKIPVAHFYTALARDELPEELTAALQPGTEYVRLAEGWHQLSDSGADGLRIWVPPQSENKTNNRSLAVYQQFGKDGLLLTGDLEAKGVHQLLATLPELPVSLLKLPHHGSRHSAPEDYLPRLNPQLAVVSAGYKNSYGLPSDQVVDLCRQRSLPLLRTDLQQTIHCSSQGRGWQATHWSHGFFRPTGPGSLKLKGANNLN